MPYLSTHEEAFEEVESSANSDDNLQLSYSGASTSTDPPTDDEGNGKLDLAKRQTIIVTRLRMLVFVCLFLASVAVSIVVYYITLQAGRQEADTQFHESRGANLR